MQGPSPPATGPACPACGDGTLAAPAGPSEGPALAHGAYRSWLDLPEMAPGDGVPPSPPARATAYLASPVRSTTSSPLGSISGWEDAIGRAAAELGAGQAAALPPLAPPSVAGSPAAAPMSPQQLPLAARWGDRALPPPGPGGRVARPVPLADALRRTGEPRRGGSRPYPRSRSRTPQLRSGVPRSRGAGGRQGLPGAAPAAARAPLPPPSPPSAAGSGASTLTTVLVPAGMSVQEAIIAHADAIDLARRAAGLRTSGRARALRCFHLVRALRLRRLEYLIGFGDRSPPAEDVSTSD